MSCGIHHESLGISGFSLKSGIADVPTLVGGGLEIETAVKIYCRYDDLESCDSCSSVEGACDVGGEAKPLQPRSIELGVVPLVVG